MNNNNKIMGQKRYPQLASVKVKLDFLQGSMKVYINSESISIKLTDVPNESISEKELEELKEMEEWQIEATFGLYDITDPRQWEEYLEYEIKWIKHIEKFSIEWMTSLDRPLIFRDLLSFFGQDWDLEGFQKMKQYYKEESDYCFTKFMEYAEILGYLDRDTTKSNIENIFDEKQEELDDDDSGDIGFRRLR